MAIEIKVYYKTNDGNTNPIFTSINFEELEWLGKIHYDSDPYDPETTIPKQY